MVTYAPRARTTPRDNYAYGAKPSYVPMPPLLEGTSSNEEHSPLPPTGGAAPAAAQSGVMSGLFPSAESLPRIPGPLPVDGPRAQGVFE